MATDAESSNTDTLSLWPSEENLESPASERPVAKTTGKALRGRRDNEGLSAAQPMASAGSIKTNKQVEAEAASLEWEAERYQQALERADAQDAAQGDVPTVSAEQLAELRARAQQRREQLKTLDATGETQISRTDPDARRLAKNGKKVTGYNVQTVVDAKHKLILAHEVTNAGNDLGQLVPNGRTGPGGARVRGRDRGRSRGRGKNAGPAAGGAGRCWLLHRVDHCGLRIAGDHSVRSHVPEDWRDGGCRTLERS